MSLFLWGLIENFLAKSGYEQTTKRLPFLRIIEGYLFQCDVFGFLVWCMMVHAVAYPEFFEPTTLTLFLAKKNSAELD
jgi:hypothetical protein